MFDKVTLFYSVNSGKIKLYCTGEQSMDYFGEDKYDYNYDFIIVKYDDFLINNLDKFSVENKELKFDSSSINYL